MTRRVFEGEYWSRRFGAEYVRALRAEARVAELELDIRRLLGVAVAAKEWLSHLEAKGGHYYDGIPGALIDALEGVSLDKWGE